jgi:hypothetical protein
LHISNRLLDRAIELDPTYGPQTLLLVQPMSALPPKADIAGRHLDVRVF